MTYEAKDRSPVEVVPATEMCNARLLYSYEYSRWLRCTHTILFRRTVRLGLSRMFEAGGTASSVRITVRGRIMIVGDVVWCAAAAVEITIVSKENMREIRNMMCLLRRREPY